MEQQSPLTKWLILLSFFLFLFPIGLSTFFLVDALGHIETYRLLFTIVLVGLAVIWSMVILAGILWWRNKTILFLGIATPMIGFIGSNEWGLFLFGLGFIAYTLVLAVQKRRDGIRKVSHALILLMLAATACLFGTLILGFHIVSYHPVASAQIEDQSYHVLTIGENMHKATGVEIWICNRNGINCGLHHTLDIDLFRFSLLFDLITIDIVTIDDQKILRIDGNYGEIYTGVIE